MSPVSMDFLEAPLNPCSVESVAEPVELQDGSRIWPVMLACYELQEDGNRQGQLDLFAVKVPDMDKNIRSKSSMLLRFGTPAKVSIQAEGESTHISGILDGKWIKSGNKGSFYYASAHSSGDVFIHACAVSNDEEYTTCLDTEAEKFPLCIRQVGKSAGLEAVNDGGPVPLCLSLNWDSPTFGDSTRIVSTYSDGRVAIHDVVRSTSKQQSEEKVQLSERMSWEAHALFTNPAEVWTAGFVGEEYGNAVLSGGDDGKLKLWDCRSTNRPMHVLKHFDAGVTVVSPHPRQPNMVACGSYDETIAIYDIRYISSAKPLGRTGPLGGGIWRIKWHPYDDGRLLVAAMHGGCRIVQIDKLENTTVMTAIREFTEHKSMAYGADWLVCNHPTQEGYFEAAASCSFYDKAVHLWDTVG